MTAIGFIVVVLSLIIFVIAFFTLHFKWNLFIFPLVLFLNFMVGVSVPSYLGYAIDSRYVQQQVNNVVLDVSQSKDYIYLFVWQEGSSEPRLIKLPATEENKKKADEAQKNAKNTGGVIRFGTSQHPGEAGQSQEDDSFTNYTFKESNVLVKDDP